jgi:hypothetical protein
MERMPRTLYSSYERGLQFDSELEDFELQNFSNRLPYAEALRDSPVQGGVLQVSRSLIIIIIIIITTTTTTTTTTTIFLQGLSQRPFPVQNFNF